MVLNGWMKVAFLLFISNMIYGQISLTDMEKELAYQADVMTNASEPQHRLIAMAQFNELFAKAVEIEGAFDYPFDNIKWISKMSPVDKSFRVYTWEVDAGQGEYKYFGIIQTNKGKVFRLTDHFKTAESFVDEEFDRDQWLGALYYNIMEATTTNGQKYYMLYGVNRWSDYENIKLIDILFFTSEDQPYFGLPVFRKSSPNEKDIYFNRLLFKYASDAQMTVNYNPGMNMIMVDNLVRKMSRIPGQGETMVPDGTYVGYELKNGFWQRIEQIAVTPMDSAPRPKPVLDNRKNMDIQGRKKPSKTK